MSHPTLQPPGVTQTLQVDDNGTRLTAHFVWLDGSKEWALRDVTSNVSSVPVTIIKELMYTIRRVGT